MTSGMVLPTAANSSARLGFGGGAFGSPTHTSIRQENSRSDTARKLSSYSFLRCTLLDGRDGGALSTLSRMHAHSAKTEVTQFVRARLNSHLVDDSGSDATGIAIYSLTDPRDLRQVRYVGQTSTPRTRYLQHLRTARLWLPDKRPWWVASPKLRPLYEWIRELYADDRRLPIMVVRTWVPAADARVAERAQICECLERRLPLLNFEAELLGRQLPLI